MLDGGHLVAKMLKQEKSIRSSRFAGFGTARVGALLSGDYGTGFSSRWNGYF